MGTGIHHSVVREGDVRLGEEVEIGPFSVLSGNIRIGPRTKIASCVRMTGNVEVGPDCHFYHGCCIGEDAQSWALWPAKRQTAGVRIGSNNIFREYVTVHASDQENRCTLVGDHNRFMVGTHVAHDCTVGNHVTVVNSAHLAGGVEVQDGAHIAAAVLVGSHCRIGRGALVSANVVTTRDVPPFLEVSRKGMILRVRVETMRGMGYDEMSIRNYRNVFKRLRKGDFWSEIYKSLHRDNRGIEEELAEFLQKSVQGVLGKVHKRK